MTIDNAIPIKATITRTCVVVVLVVVVVVLQPPPNLPLPS
jgi:hypothetical protein